jgi:hypothetical protein
MPSSPIGAHSFRSFRTIVGVTFLVVAGASSSLEATPQFARKYRKDCSFCHLAPPILNARGEAFVARGYRLEEVMTPVPSHKTVPLAVWSSLDYEHRSNSTTNRGFPSRVELISAGPIGASRAAYFAEWRLLSQQIASGNTLLNRSGRFEDLFVTAPIASSPISITVGQFRAISQVDVSRRLSISEPQVFSAGLSGKPASSSRLTGLRAFAPSGRQPAIRVMWQQQIQDRPADGWYAGGAVLFSGELTIPLTDAASFEFEGRPKGALIESYRRSGVSSFGGHVFVGDDRRLAMAVAAVDVGSRILLTGAAGFETIAGATESRVSLQGEVFLRRLVAVAGRIEDRTGAARRVAGVLSANVHLPFAQDWFRQALRLQIEQRIQGGDHRTLVSLSHVF